MRGSRHLEASSNGAPLVILGANATNPGIGQTLTITDWDMAFAGGGAKTLDGNIAFEVRGGDFMGTFVYPHRSSPDIELEYLQKLSRTSSFVTMIATCPFQFRPRARLIVL